MSIFAVAKKKIGFRNGDTGEILTVSPFEYATLPDWVKKDPMYGWAVEDGSLEIPKQEKPKPDTPKKPEVPEEPPEELDTPKKPAAPQKTPEGDGKGDK